MALIHIQRNLLEIKNDGKPLASGGSAVVFEVQLKKMTGRLPLGTYLFKEYKSFQINGISESHLNSVVDRITLNKDSKLTSRLAIPLALVFSGKVLMGFLMKKLDQGCTFNLSRRSGASEQKLMRLDYFLASEESRKNLGVPDLDYWRRWAIILDFWETLSKLHESGVVVGDISDKNLVVLRKSGAKVSVRDRLIVLDVDGFSTKTHLGNMNAFTPLWDAPEETSSNFEEAKRKDVYKAGLASFRLLASGFSRAESSFGIRNFNQVGRFLERRFGREGYSLLVSTLSYDPDRRPKADYIYRYLKNTVGVALKDTDASMTEV